MYNILGKLENVPALFDGVYIYSDPITARSRCGKRISKQAELQQIG
jgi:hypothetical protein